ncbi:hypothetical protein CUJ90_07000 [Paraburkholderia terricola]|nr:hypothetical protein CUJ90_07000 [Paraburkholderia terricola]
MFVGQHCLALHCQDVISDDCPAVKTNSIEPYGYLVALFKALPCVQNVDDYVALLPSRPITSTD